jgi:hypothetical protein
LSDGPPRRLAEGLPSWHRLGGRGGISGRVWLPIRKAHSCQLGAPHQAMRAKVLAEIDAAGVSYSAFMRAKFVGVAPTPRDRRRHGHNTEWRGILH